MTVTEMQIADLSSEIVKFVLEKSGDSRVKVAALQVAQHVLGQANAIEEANKAAGAERAKKPTIGGAFL